MVSGILFGVGAIAIRSVTGWLENSLEDGKIQKYEWLELGSTALRLGLITTGLYLGLELGTVEAVSSGVVLDMILTKLKK